MRKWTPMPKHPNIYTYKTARGTRYAVRRGFRNSVGKRVEFTKSGLLTWRDADKILKEFEAGLVSGQIGPISSAGVTLGAYFDQMVERKMKFAIWRESTYDVHVRYFNNHIRPVLGMRKIGELERRSYQQFIDSLDADKHLATSTIKTIHRIMMETINSAVNEDVIDKNRLKRIEIHGHAAKSVDLAPEDFKRWMAAAELVLDKYGLALIKVAALGLRRGEVLGLRTSSIQFATDEVNGGEIASITIDMQRGIDYPLGGPLKTSTSYRTIWVSGEIIDYLHHAILASNNLRRKGGIAAGKPEWLWVNRFGAPASYSYLFERMKLVNEATGLNVRPHMLRHFFATNGIGANVSDVALMQYLGHKNLQMTADYARPTKATSLDVFRNVNAHMTGTESEK